MDEYNNRRIYFGDEPRRWGWWVGAAWLIAAVAALLIRWPPLLVLVWLLMIGMLLAFAVDALRTGTVDAEFGQYSRYDSPGLFWLHVWFYLLFAVVVAAAPFLS